MIVWSGFGFLVALITFGVLFATATVAEKLSGNPQFYEENSWVISVGMIVSALFTFVLAQLLNKQKPRVVIDKNTGQEIELRRNHSLFWIPVKWWPIILVALSVAVYFIEKK